jgi:ubiquinol-cytochrome c reductase iron-sulfur subunit
MADKGTAEHGTAVTKREAPTPSPGTAVVPSDKVQNPGFPPYRPRVSDLDPVKERQNERRVAWLFWVSIIGSVFAIVAYIVFPIVPGDLSTVRNNNLLLGLGIALAMFGIGFGAVHWSKSLMDGHDLVESRHPTRGSEETREKAVEVFHLGNKESGFTRRKLIRNSLIGALVVSPLPAVVLFRDLAPAGDPIERLKHTLWDKNVRLTRDPDGTPIKASDVTLGSVFHVIPEGLADMHEGKLEEKAKAAVLLMRLKPEDLQVSMSSRPTTCCAPATSRSSTSPARPPSSSARPSVPCRSCPSPSTRKGTWSRAATSPSPSARASGSDRCDRRSNQAAHHLVRGRGHAHHDDRRAGGAAERRDALHQLGRELHRRAHQPLGSRA